MDGRWIHLILLHRDTLFMFSTESSAMQTDSTYHMATIPALPAVAFILTDAAIDTDTSVLAALARTLAIAALLTLAAPLAARFAG